MAIGHDNNRDNATLCSVINNKQNEVGSGGNVARSIATVSQ